MVLKILVKAKAMSLKRASLQTRLERGAEMGQPVLLMDAVLPGAFC